MTYPEDFVSAVKSAYPDWANMHRALEVGSEMVGSYLDDTRHWAPNPGVVVEMIDEGRVDELRAEAKKHATALELYKQWGKIADSQR